MGRDEGLFAAIGFPEEAVMLEESGGDRAGYG
jgi:hypothetical protein